MRWEFPRPLEPWRLLDGDLALPCKRGKISQIWRLVHLPSRTLQAKGGHEHIRVWARSTTVVAQWGVLAGSGYNATKTGPTRLFPETFKRRIIRAARVLRPPRGQTRPSVQ